MIKTLLFGAARSLFLLAAALAALAALAGYCSFRLVRAAIRNDHGMPVRDSAFTALTALVVLVRALQEGAARAKPRPDGPGVTTVPEGDINAWIEEHLPQPSGRSSHAEGATDD